MFAVEKCSVGKLCPYVCGVAERYKLCVRLSNLRQCW